MVTHSFSYRIGWGLSNMSSEDRADALEDSAGDCGALVGLDLLAYGIRVCGVDSPYHHTVR